MTDTLTLVSHKLCPYVQRVAIALLEKEVACRRVDIHLARKPGWFLRMSPLGKTPVLRVGDAALFKSAAILEYLEDTAAPALHPSDPIERARHRAWIEFGSAVLADIAGFYSARDAETFEAKSAALWARFQILERELSAGPYFGGARFTLVDAAFAPVFRYFELFDRIAEFGILADAPAVAAWRRSLAARPSVRAAAPSDYRDRLARFVATRQSHLSTLMMGTVS